MDDTASLALVEMLGIMAIVFEPFRVYCLIENSLGFEAVDGIDWGLQCTSCCLVGCPPNVA